MVYITGDIHGDPMRIYALCDPSKLNSIDVLAENDIAHIALYMSMQVLRSKEF